ncbi:MAG: hypothetical protein COU31_02785 [Candidatus Magasanikbacteria bacterium CG10_big_fil_rev_8_21_14_0_10_40_10]|uniref:Uncharacterized protein n=1 Tax=Candidatus Magasanikbacteria bacterium CG10_big_fil_rev_8_21_14_0_10_40_10 TaxID=1974648 RepID=A0A2M6W3V7_9BACT|nr:MAG: hypothetical protein COU31_02785 [Candidatus Magasanikbacteria bacterium CG10_big_fil_rev_8_21_14_0_10_40_10]
MTGLPGRVYFLIKRDFSALKKISSDSFPGDTQGDNAFVDCMLIISKRAKKSSWILIKIIVLFFTNKICIFLYVQVLNIFLHLFPICLADHKNL